MHDSSPHTLFRVKFSPVSVTNIFIVRQTYRLLVINEQCSTFFRCIVVHIISDSEWIFSAHGPGKTPITKANSFAHFPARNVFVLFKGRTLVANSNITS